MSNENKQILLSIENLRSLAEKDFKQLTWLTQSILSARTVNFKEPDHVMLPSMMNQDIKKEHEKIWCPSMYYQECVRIDLEYDYTDLTAIPWQECSMQLESLLGDLRIRGYFRAHEFQTKEEGKSSFCAGVMHHLLKVWHPDFPKFDSLWKDLIQVNEEVKYKHEQPLYSKAEFRFDAKNNILHKDFCEKTLHLKKTRGKNNKVDLLNFIFSKNYNTGDWIKSDTEGIRGKLSGEQLYHAAYDLNEDIEEVFDVSDFFELDHQYRWVKSHKT